jgi:hypothetical protein
MSSSNTEIAAALRTDTDSLRAEIQAYKEVWIAFAGAEDGSEQEKGMVPAVLKAAAKLGSAAVKLGNAAESARKVKGQGSGQVRLAASFATEAAVDAVEEMAIMVRWFGIDHAKGSYQEALVRGGESWSGSTLKGKASSYGSSYSASRDALQTRISMAATEAAGVRFDIKKIGGRCVAVFVLPVAPVAG